MPEFFLNVKCHWIAVYTRQAPPFIFSRVQNDLLYAFLRAYHLDFAENPFPRKRLRVQNLQKLKGEIGIFLENVLGAFRQRALGTNSKRASLQSSVNSQFRTYLSYVEIPQRILSVMNLSHYQVQIVWYSVHVGISPYFRLRIQVLQNYCKEEKFFESYTVGSIYEI